METPEREAPRERRTLCGVLPDELERWMASNGQPRYRANQVLGWVHRRGVLDPSLMSNVPAALRELLARDFLPVAPGAAGPGAKLAAVARSADGTRKLAVAFADGAAVETVLIPDEDGGKVTQCVSTQVGCAYSCRFCLSGAGGLRRNLTADEIVVQVHLARTELAETERLANVVLMGSGEPLANYPETTRAIRLLTSPRAVALSTRRVTLSTIGIPRGIRRLGEDFGGTVALAVSLHGPDDATRAALLPRVADVPIDDVLAALRAYPLPPRRRITVEYVLVAGVNASEAQAAALARRLEGLRVKVNLIPFNQHQACDLTPPAADAVERFQRVLLDRGVTAIVRKERGADIGAACGQLVARGPSPT
jgi:23S rRNA (adenine2503-C2)-methyltransferase